MHYVFIDFIYMSLCSVYLQQDQNSKYDVEVVFGILTHTLSYLQDLFLVSGVTYIYEFLIFGLLTNEMNKS